MKSPGDRCSCGHTRNHHSGWGLGRCLVVDGCTCPGPLRTITDVIEFSVPMLPDAARRMVEAATR